MSRQLILLCGAAVLGPAAAAWGQEAPEDTQALRAQIDRLRERLDALERGVAAPIAPALGPASAVTGGGFPGSWRLPGSDTSMSFSGYAKADSFFTFNAPSDAIGDSFVLSNIPLKGSAANSQGGDYRMHSRQSRIRFDTDTPTDWGRLQTRIEGDFFGRNNDQQSTTSFSFRMHQAFARLGPVLAGQVASTFEDDDTEPEMIDNFGAAGDSDVRQTMIRYTAQFDAGFHLDAAFENPFASVATPTGAAITISPNMIDRMPDTILRLRYKGTWGAVNASGVMRYFEYDDGRGGTASAMGGGGHLGAHAKLWDKDMIGFNFNGGPGLGRYIQTTNTSPETNAVCAGGSAAALTTGCPVDLTVNMVYGGWLQYTHYWADNWHSNAIYGYMHADIPVAQLGAGANGLSRNIQSTAVNLIWNPVPKVMFGLEYMAGWRYVARAAPGTQDYGTASRLQLGMRYGF